MNEIKITFIKKEKGSYKVNILSNDIESKYNITEDLLIESRFLSLRNLTIEEYNLFLSKLPLDYLALTSIKYLDKRVKSEKELREYLLTHTSSNEMIDIVIEKLKKKKMLDDELYKKSLLNELIYYKRDGRLLINQKLNERGLSSDFIYPLDALKDNIDKLTIAFDKKNYDLSNQEKINKLKIYLLHKGYTERDINNNLDFKLLTTSNELSNLKRDFEKLKKRYDDKEKITIELLKKGYSNRDIIELWREYD